MLGAQLLQVLVCIVKLRFTTFNFLCTCRELLAPSGTHVDGVETTTEQPHELLSLLLIQSESRVEDLLGRGSHNSTLAVES